MDRCPSDCIGGTCRERRSDSKRQPMKKSVFQSFQQFSAFHSIWQVRDASSSSERGPGIAAIGEEQG